MRTTYFSQKVIDNPIMWINNNPIGSCLIEPMVPVLDQRYDCINSTAHYNYNKMCCSSQ